LLQKKAMPDRYAGWDWFPQWKTFLSACVLYDPPKDKLLEFAAYSDPEPDLVLPKSEEDTSLSELPFMVAPPIRSLQRCS